MDCFIKRTGITCVVAAGNDGYNNGDIFGPAYALNCITVGNLQTKSSGSTAISSSTYSIHDSSSWEEPNAFANKPDICAPGTFIRAVKSTTDVNTFYYDDEIYDPTGTSFSAPVITGVVALMMQEHSAKIGRPYAVKAKIMNTANAGKVSTVENPTAANDFIREKSGAGMVDAVKAMSGYAYSYCPNVSTVAYSYSTVFTVNLSAGQKLRATLAFTNQNTSVIINSCSDYYDIDLRMVDANTGAVLCSSFQGVNNVEIVEYTASKACTVNIQTRVASAVEGTATDWALEVDRY